MTRKVLTPIIVIAVCLGMLVVDETPAAASTYTYSWQYNIQGGLGWQGDSFPIEALANQWSNTPASQRPSSISLNEMCLSQYYYAVAVFAPLGYYGQWSTAKSSASSCGGGQYGIAVLMTGPTLNVSLDHTYNAQSTSDTSGSEYRKMTCMRRIISGYALYSACSTHITSKETCYSSTRKHSHQQTDEASYVAYLMSNDDAIWTIVGGDWNLPPEEKRPTSCPSGSGARVLSGWYTDYEEADGYLLSTGSHATHRDGDKLDYVWMNDAYVNAAPLVPSVNFVFYQGSGVSDHGLVRGRFLI